MHRSFLEKISKRWLEGNFVCIGLDSGDFGFNKKIINQTVDLVCAYKLNSAFYESTGSEGFKSLKQTIDYIHQKTPDLPVILDAKRGDIENTNAQYAKAIFDSLGADATTVHPYLGKESLQPFLDKTDFGIFVLVKTSNPGAGEFQDLLIEGKPLYQIVAQHVTNWNKNGNLGVVVGATYPEELSKVRKIIGDMPILIPGIGAQGGNLKATVKNGINSHGQGIIISSSREIIFADNPREATLKLTNQIQSVLSDLSSHSGNDRQEI